MSSLLKRFPKFQEVLPVYAVGVAILYTWSALTSIKDFASNWNLYLNIAEILSLFAYIMAGAFLESLIVIATLLIISFLLPRKILTDQFILRGASLTIAFLGSIIALYVQTSIDTFFANITGWAVAFVVSALVLIFSGKYVRFVKNTIEFIADRCIVFLYIYLPISLVSIIVVLIRNI